MGDLFIYMCDFLINRARKLINDNNEEEKSKK